MKFGIGIDIGTFHTVATSVHEKKFCIPRHSIPSIALRIGNRPIVGNDAKQQLDISDSLELILAPKLLLNSDSNQDFLQNIISKLARLALEDIDYVNNQSGNVVITVPPGWTMVHCHLLEEAVEQLSIKASFIHEPIALLIATMYLSTIGSEQFSAKLENADLFLVCDWGAGTVDIALVRVLKKGCQYEFSCEGEFTDKQYGGTSLARDIVYEYDKFVDIDKMAYHLQSAWQGEELLDLSHYKPLTNKHRSVAATDIAKKINQLFNENNIKNTDSIVCIFHGGPLESDELRSFLKDKLMHSMGLASGQFLHIGNQFSESLPFDKVPWRRDVLVSAGASLFASRGSIFPEFKYEIALRDSFGCISSRAPLEIKPNLGGIQVIKPPFTGCDYYVDVQQIRKDGTKTSQNKELSLYVRPDAVLIYRICEAGVGFARIEVTEAEDLPVPIPFSDARSEWVRLPECSTRFSIDF